MKSKLAARLFSRRLYFLIFSLAVLAFQIGSNAQTQSSRGGVEPPDCYFLEPVCIMDPFSGRCLRPNCNFIPPPTPTPTPVCVEGPCLPAPTPTPACLPLEPIDPCPIVFDSACVAEEQPCVTPPPLGLPAQGSVPLVISEFRFRGPGGANDEFVELFNASNSPVTVSTSDGSAGWSLVASDGLVRFTIPVGTVIPAHAHYLAVNNLSYSLDGYPAGNGAGATGDTLYILDIPDRAGIALFSTSNPTNFTINNRADAAGYSTATQLYREGAGFPVGAAETLFNIQYSFYRDLASGLPKDTNDNRADFKGVDTNAANTGAGQRLGAPGPENLSSPILMGSSQIQVSLLDPAVAQDESPNRVRDTTPNPMNNSSFGTLSFRRTFTNVSGANITRLRFRIIDTTTYPYMTGTSDIRAISSTADVVTRSDGSNVFLNGTTLETPPDQVNGGGWNSTLSASSVTPSLPLPPGQSISLQFLMGVQQSGNFRFFIVVEASQ
jgi:Lamin Tail Domain